MTFSTRVCGALAVLAACTTVSPEVSAQASAPWAGNDWRFGVTLYLYGPKIDANLSLPRRSGDGSITVDTSDFFDSINGAFMGAFEANNGRWGMFTDFLYVDVSGSQSATRNFSLGGINLPGSVTGNVDVGIKGSAWTIAGEYRLQSTSESTVDLLLGARMLDVKPRVGFSLNGDLATIPIQSRSANFEVKQTNWDAIIGFKSRWAFGDRRQWYVPLYADIGAGDSRLTWQAAGGIGYAYGWGDIVGLWRYMRYDLKSDNVIQDLSFNGPMIGVTFRW